MPRPASHGGAAGPLRLRARRPQLKRDSLGGHIVQVKMVQQIRWFSLLAVGLVGLPRSRSGLACKCINPGAPREALARATAVFVGRVLDIAHGPGPGRASVRVTLLVSRGWKGVAQDTVKVVTGSGGGDCGYGFGVDGEYLVYAVRLPDSPSLYVSRCSRTALAEGSGDVMVLGTPSYKRHR